MDVTTSEDKVHLILMSTPDDQDVQHTVAPRKGLPVIIRTVIIPPTRPPPPAPLPPFPHRPFPS